MLRAIVSSPGLKRSSWLMNTHSSTETLSQMYSTTKQKSKYKAVVFDLGGVFMPSPIHAIREIEAQYKMEPYAFGKRIAYSKEFADLEKGVIDLEEFAARTKDLFLDLIPVEKQRDAIFRIFASVTFEDTRYNVVAHAAKCLKADGLRTALLTNNWAINKNLHEHPLPISRKMFDAVVESWRVGFRKPEPEIYNFTLKQLGVNAEEAVFVDDLGHNLKAARQLGMHTIKAENPKQVVDDLERLLNLSLRHFAPGTVSPTSHLQLPLDKLQSYLNSTIKPPVTNELPAVRQFVNGRSNPTYFVAHGDMQLALRRKPPGKLLPSAHLIDREYKLFSALLASNVPVPKVRSYCSDPSVLGSEFFVMDYINGAIYKDMKLPDVAPERRRKLYTEMNNVLANIHSVDVDAVGLGNWGKREKYLERNLGRWVHQYESSKTADHPAMSKLISWLKQNCPKDSRITLIHGDFRLDNLIFDKQADRVLSVLDWELSTLGDPLTDLATSVFHYFVPSVFTIFSGMSDIPLASLSLPSVKDHVAEYFRFAKVQPPSDPNFLNFYLAFIAFRYAAIAQGVYKRAIGGQSSSPGSEKFGAAVPILAQMALKLVEGDGVRLSSGKSSASSSSPSESSSGIALTPDNLAPKARGIYKKLSSFIETKIAPLEKKLLNFYADLQGEARWTAVCPDLEQLKADAKKEGLWNLWLCRDLDPNNRFGGAGLTNVEYAYMAELMGRYQPFAPEVFNCAAPDTGNMEVLIKYGNGEQQKRWLDLLLAGEIRSAFAMTEPDVASSDATNISASIARDGDYLVLNGKKWWTSGIMNPKCQVIIYLGKSDALKASNPIHRQHSMVLVPRNAPGVKVVRPLPVFGFDDNVHGGHGEVWFENVRVPAKEALLLDEGRGFEMGQGRLGPGRIHHCMRLIGMSARAIDMSVDRTLSRVAFGRRLAERDSVRDVIAKSATELEMARLLVLKAAHLIDTVGSKGARREIAMIKAVVPTVAQTIIDRAMQMHGGAGVSQDYPLAGFMAGARALRLADGPDEVHWRTIGGMIYKPKL